MRVIKKVTAFVLSVGFSMFSLFGFMIPDNKVSAETSASLGTATRAHIRNELDKIKIGGKTTAEIHDAYGGGTKAGNLTRVDESETSVSGKVYFCGNEYSVINFETTGTNDYVYLMASLPYLWIPFKYGPTTMVGTGLTNPFNVYKDSIIQKYLNSTDATNPSIIQSSEKIWAENNRGYVATDFAADTLPTGGAYEQLKSVNLKKPDNTNLTTLYNDFLTKSQEYDILTPVDVNTTYFGKYSNDGTAVDTAGINSSSDSEIKNMISKLTSQKFWLPSVNLKDTLPTLCCHPAYDYNAINSTIDVNASQYCVPLNNSLPSYPSSELGNALVRTPDSASFYCIKAVNSAGLAAKVGSDGADPSGVGSINGLYPVCKIDLSKVVFANNSQTDSKLGTNPVAYNLITGDEFSNSNLRETPQTLEKPNNVVLTVKGKEMSGVSSLKGDVALTANGTLTVKVPGTVPAGKYLAVLLDNGTITSFLTLNSSQLSNGTYTVENTGFKQGSTQIDVYLCENNSTDIPKAQNLSSEFKIRYVNQISSTTITPGESFIFDQTDARTGVRLQGNFPEGSKLVVKIHEDDKTYFEIVKKNIDQPEKIEKYIAYDVTVLDKNEKEIKENFGTAYLWLPIPSAYNKDEIQVRRVLEGIDETKTGTITEMVGTDNTKKEYYKVPITHLSPFMLANMYKNVNFPKTGNQFLLTYISFLGSGVLIIGILLTKKYSKKHYNIS